MKQIITILLVIAILLLPTQQPRAQLVPALCITAFAALAVGGVVVCVKSCQPVYYCVQDDEAAMDYCMITTRRDAAAAGLTIKGGPFKDVEKCDTSCHVTNLLTGLSLPLVTIEKSTDLVTWTVCGSVAGTLDCFEWSETNRVDQAAFYRARQ